MSSTMKKVKQLTIDQSKWGTGALYEDGAYCALGFLCKALGFKNEELEGAGIPSELITVPEWMDRQLTQEQKEALIDDDEDVPDELSFENAVWETNDHKMSINKKKAQLKQLFKIVGINLHFKNSENSLMK